MTPQSPEDIVRKALEKDELDLLLLGKPGYQYLPKWSPAPGDTDVTSLLSALGGLVGEYPRAEIRDRLHRAIMKIVETYEGLDPVAHCLFFEAYDRSEGRPPLGLPAEEIAAELKQSIRVFSFRLEKDKTYNCGLLPDGRLGGLRQLSRTTERFGGPSFCD